jgi:predicted amidophosphoribosyltransferase
MALIECPECKKEISDKAAACPQCGCPIPSAQPAAACNKAREMDSDPPIRISYVCLPPESSVIKAECNNSIIKGARFYHSCLMF